MNPAEGGPAVTTPSHATANARGVTRPQRQTLHRRSRAPLARMTDAAIERPTAVVAISSWACGVYDSNCFWWPVTEATY